MSDYLESVDRKCPVCKKRGMMQGIQNVGKWMECPNDHEWGYEDASQ